MVRAAAPTVKAEPFFRSPGALFPSGEARPADLEKNKIRDYHELAFNVQKDGRLYRLAPELILRDVDLSFRVAHLRSSQTGVLVGRKDAWAFVVTDSAKDRQWWALTEVIPVPDDLGLAVPLMPVQLRSAAKWSAKLIKEIPTGTRLRLLRIQDHWVEVSPVVEPSKKGWVDLGALVLKHDFATFALPRKGKWTPVRYRQGPHFVLSSGEKLPIEDVKALMTRPDLAMIAQSLPAEGLRLRSFVTITSWDFVRWTLSRLPGHGEVYWKSLLQNSRQSVAQDFLSFDEILKRPVFSVAFDPNNPRRGIISAEGIFKTEDGLNWERVKSFQNDNLPVAISPQGEFFVGSFRSTDSGKTFLPYLKWEQVTKLIEGKNRKAPKVLRLVRVEPLGNHKVRIEVDNGARLARLQGSTKFGLITRWEKIKKF